MGYFSEIIVTAHSNIPHGTLQIGEASYPCLLGKKGVTEQKREGDLCTPLGTYPLRYVFYRADKISAPATGLPVLPLSASLGWCDASEDANYNRLVTHPYAASAEKLWRDDCLYDVIVVLGHNDSPPLSGEGSAIFMHIMRDDGVGTEGCIALKHENLLAVLAKVDCRSVVTIRRE